jgi:hypothetical protein
MWSFSNRGCPCTACLKERSRVNRAALFFRCRTDGDGRDGLRLVRVIYEDDRIPVI